MDPERNLGTLLMEFFELYGKNYNYDEVGIAIRRGGFYYSKRARGWYQGNKAYLLSVEDPQDPGKYRYLLSGTSLTKQITTFPADHSV